MAVHSFDRLSGRQIIESDTEIIGGVLLAQQAIPVDFEERRDVYEDLYTLVVANLPGGSADSPLNAVQAVSEVITDAVKFDKLQTGKVLKAIADERGLSRRLGPTDETLESRFIEAGFGICDHQSLVGGGMLQLLEQRRGLIGTTSLERRGIHSSIRHTTPRQRIVMDIAEGRVLVLGHHPRRVEHPYLRPRERMRSVAQTLHVSPAT